MSDRHVLGLDAGRIFELSMDLLATANFDGYFEALSPSWEAVLGWTLDELRSRPFSHYVHPDDRVETATELERLAGGQVTISFENRYQHKRGGWVWLEWNARPSDEENLVYAVARDVTARKEVEDLRREFISNVSHELRTPLTAIRGSLGLLAGGVMGELPADAAELIQIACASSERLIRLVNDMLDLEKLAAGASPLVARLVSLRDLAEAAVAEVGSVAKAKTVTINIELTSEDPQFHCDVDGGVQVLVNLLANALNFAPSGSRVTVAGGASDDGEGWLEVRDQGPGIPDALFPRLFERFTQGATVGGGGSGLGLAICRAIVEQHGGLIQARNLELGCCVRATFPAPNDEAGSGS